MDLDQIRIDALLAEATGRLVAASDSPVQDTRILLGSVIGQDLSYLLARSEEVVDSGPAQRFRDLVEQRAKRVPIAYLLGHKEFWSLELVVTPDTLIPRPETETLVEAALVKIPDGTSAQIADLGTGSGAIALALAKERPQCRVLGTDACEKALAIAQTNGHRLNLTNVTFVTVESWLPEESQLFDCIVSNPPYVAEDHVNFLDTEISHEPRRALAAGPEGLDAIKQIIGLAPNRLTPSGWLFLEHGYDQRDAVKDLMTTTGFEKITCTPDLAGMDRVTQGQWQP